MKKWLLLFLLSSNVYADWDTTDKVLAVSAMTVTTLDWMQSRYIAKNPTLYQENNTLLGEHPSVGRVNTYFMGSILAGTAAAYVVPSEYRKYLLGGIMLMEVDAVTRNKRIGIRLAF